MKKYVCPKCGGEHFEMDAIAVSGTGFSKYFDVQNRKFTGITCKRCKYTEFYKEDVSTLSKIFDFMTSNG